MPFLWFLQHSATMHVPPKGFPFVFVHPVQDVLKLHFVQSRPQMDVDMMTLLLLIFDKSNRLSSLVLVKYPIPIYEPFDSYSIARTFCFVNWLRQVSCPLIPCVLGTHGGDRGPRSTSGQPAIRFQGLLRQPNSLKTISAPFLRSFF